MQMARSVQTVMRRLPPHPRLQLPWLPWLPSPCRSMWVALVISAGLVPIALFVIEWLSQKRRIRREDWAMGMGESWTR